MENQNENVTTLPTVTQIEGHAICSGFGTASVVPIEIGFITNASIPPEPLSLSGDAFKPFNIFMQGAVVLQGVAVELAENAGAPVGVQLLFGTESVVQAPSTTSPNVRVVISNYQITSVTDTTLE